MPKNYYKNDDVNDEILVKWRSHAYLLFQIGLTIMYIKIHHIT